MTREELRKFFFPLFADTGGIDSWIGSRTRDEVVARLTALTSDPLTHGHFNQLLLISQEAGMSLGFFEYYWLTAPAVHAYPVRSLAGFDEKWLSVHGISSLEHLKWGFTRFYIDALLYFGSVRNAYRYLRGTTLAELMTFFAERCFDVERLKLRGQPMELRDISREDRYFISEQACKSFAPAEGDLLSMKNAVSETYRKNFAATGQLCVRDIIERAVTQPEFSDRKNDFLLAASSILDDQISDQDELDELVEHEARRFAAAFEAGRHNTELYLSMVYDLDVYVATSMGAPSDFVEMAAFCTNVFGAAALKDLCVRYFDPTLSSAATHEDKGLIECLMVKSASALVYYAGVKESYGKVAEAAMALSQGKPVIFYCPGDDKRRFFREVHPLTRLIDFDTGVAVGAMVASTEDEVIELLRRIFTNEMRYRIVQPREDYLKLEEDVTKCTVRLQTSNSLLRETFWNYYHREPEYGRSSRVMPPSKYPVTVTPSPPVGVREGKAAPHLVPIPPAAG